MRIRTTLLSAWLLASAGLGQGMDAVDLGPGGTPPEAPAAVGPALITHPSERDADGNELPLEGKVAVVLVHGYGQVYMRAPALAGAFTWTGLTGALQPLREPIPREDRRAKFFLYTYRPDRPYPELAATFADTVAERLLEGPGAASKVIFVAHSAGTLMSRYAAADPRVLPKVAGILTLAGIHRGSVQASLVAAHGLGDRPGIGADDLALLDELRQEVGLDPRVSAEDPASRIPCRADPACAVIASIAFDNFDGSITPEDEQRHGMLVNHELAAFNRRDPNLHRIYTYHGLVSDLGTERPGRPFLSRLFGGRARGAPAEEVPSEAERQRRLLEKVHPDWATADPLVTFESGIFDDTVEPVAQQTSYPEVDHRKILWNLEVQTQLASDLMRLVQLASLGREHELLEAARGAPRAPQVPPAPDALPGFGDLDRTE